MTEIYVKVKTGQKHFNLETGTILKASLTQKAQNNRANTELVERLSDILNKRVGLIKGHKKPRKKVKVDLNKNQINKRVEEWQKHQ